MIHTWWKIVFFFFSTFTLTFHRIHIFTGVLFVRRTITQRVTLVKPSAISHTISPILRRQPELLSPFFPPARNGRQPAKMSKVDAKAGGGSKVFAEFYQMKRLKRTFARLTRRRCETSYFVFTWRNV